MATAASGANARNVAGGGVDASLHTESVGQLGGGGAGRGASVTPKPVVQLSMTDRILGSLARYRISVWSINGIGLALIAGVGLLLIKKFNPLVGRGLLLAAVVGALAQAWRSYAYRASIEPRAIRQLRQTGRDSADPKLIQNTAWELEMNQARDEKNRPLRRYLYSIMPEDARVHLQSQIQDTILANGKK